MFLNLISKSLKGRLVFECLCSTHMYTLTHTNTLARTLIHTCTQTHTHTLTHTCTHAHLFERRESRKREIWNNVKMDNPFHSFLPLSVPPSLPFFWNSVSLSSTGWLEVMLSLLSMKQQACINALEGTHRTKWKKIRRVALYRGREHQ